MKKIVSPTLMVLLVVLLSIGLTSENASAQSTPRGDYDTDDDGLIEVSYIEQLNAIRYDLDGNGSVSLGNLDAYSAAFPGADPLMGCPNSGCIGYEMMRDLDFDDPSSYASGTVNNRWTDGFGWLSIGFDKDNPFSTIFDGNYHIVANLFVNRRGDNDPGVTGLFGRNAGIIRQVGLRDADVTGVNYVGALVGENSGRISESHAAGIVSGDNHVGGLVGSNTGSGNVSSSYTDVVVSGIGYIGAVGGLVGLNRGMLVDNYAVGDVSSDWGSIGGLVGINHGTVSYNYANGNVSSMYLGDAGGLVGYNSGIVRDSYATGAVLGNSSVGGLVGENSDSVVASYSAGQVSGDDYVGGLVGDNAGRINASYSTSIVSGGDHAGGLVGGSSGRITASYAAGAVSGDSNVGGLVGENGSDSTIIASYGAGNVSGSNYVGGLTGVNDGVIMISYAVGSVVSDDRIGGVAGQNAASAAIIASYWDNQAIGEIAGVGEGPAQGALGKSTVELQQPTDYTGIYIPWQVDIDNADGDFDETTGIDDVWDFGSGLQYPVLKVDFNGDGIPTWWEFGNQQERPIPTPTPTPTLTPTPTITPTPTLTPIPTITPTPTPSQTPTPMITSTPTPSQTPTPTLVPIDTSTPIPTATPTPTDMPAPTETPIPMPSPRNTPPLDQPPPVYEPAGGCNSPADVSIGTSVVNLLLMVAPLGMIGCIQYARRRKK